jgi:hypothetical protein
VRRALVVALVVLAVLGVGGYIADTLVRGRVEAQAAEALQSRLGLGQRPDVSLGGFPFSMAFLTRSVPDARASAALVPLAVAGRKVQLSGVRVQTGQLSLVANQVRVAKADATGVLDYGSLSTVAGVPVAYAGDGRVKVSYVVDAGAQKVSIGVSAVPVLDAKAGEIRLTEPQQDEDSQRTVRLPASRLEQVARPIPVALGEGARLTAFVPSEGGVAVGATLTDVVIPLG